MINNSDDIKSFDIPKTVVEILSKEGITKLYPPQAKALPAALDGENLVLAIPTASGKSLVAYLSILRSVLSGGKALYIVPLRALASEKFNDLKKFESLGLKVELSMGNLDSPDPKLNDFDIIIATSEKTDSLLRHRSFWLKNITVIVADEIHLINDSSRGPTLELILARFKLLNPKAQIIALSATIQNSIELASWLNAKHIQSDWRPVKLFEGVFYNNQIKFLDNSIKKIPKVTDEITSLVLDSIKEGAQVLIFVNTRRSTEALARRLAKPIERLLSSADQKSLKTKATDFISSHTEVTTLAKEISSLISSGVAFHHAGLSDSQRKSIESNFKNGLIKCIIATPTLAAGINLPARRVIVRDVSRFDVELGITAPIPILEIKQMMGRAGRPKYDTIGEAVLIAKNSEMADELREGYLLKDAEPIYSKLGMERALRTHILAAIASEFVSNEPELEDYLSKTFYALQSESYTLSNQIEKVLDFLKEHELIRIIPETSRFIASEFGKRTSDLYIDPESAVILRRALERADKVKIPLFAYLHTICSTPDMLTFYLRRNDYEWVEAKITEIGENFIHKWFETPIGYDDFLSQVKTACMLDDWISERSEEYISNKYNIGPGDIRNKVETGKWLMHSMHELARLFKSDYQSILNKLSLRIKYGVDEELLSLVSLRGIGRVRARTLFKHGYKDKSALKKADITKLSRIPSIGPTIATNIKTQLEE